MKRWITRPWLWALPALTLLTAPVSAQSITFFGSIIVTSLGTEGMTVQVPDGMSVTTTQGSAPDTASTGVTGPATVDIRPVPPINGQQPPTNQNGNTGSGTGTPTRGGSNVGTAQTGQTNPSVTEVVDPLPIESPPVDTPVITDPPPPSVDDPILTTTVDVPATPVDPPVVIDDGNIQTVGGDPVLDTPEPATLTLLGIGGIGALVARRKRRAS